jgi:hypothetical protein
MFLWLRMVKWVLFRAEPLFIFMLNIKVMLKKVLSNLFLVESKKGEPAFTPTTFTTVDPEEPVDFNTWCRINEVSSRVPRKEFLN